MALLLLMMVLLASYVCVRVGAVAFELTGIPWDQAKFQALSAFSNCGFTTREAEDIVENPLRRRIATYLILSGNAGVVTTIATLANALVGADVRRAVVSLFVVALCIGVISWLGRRPILAQRVRLAVQRWLARRADFQPSAEALLRVDQGFHVSRVSLPDASLAVGRRVSEMRSADHDLLILAIERKQRFLPIPNPGEVIEAGDTLVVYGTKTAILAALGAEAPLDPQGHMS